MSIAPMCPKGCGMPMVVTQDALGRGRLRCPNCDRLATPRRLRPGEVLTVQTLTNALPKVAPGQLRCQDCGHGVEGKTARFCPRCWSVRHNAGALKRRKDPPAAEDDPAERTLRVPDTVERLDAPVKRAPRVAPTCALCHRELPKKVGRPATYCSHCAESLRNQPAKPATDQSPRRAVRRGPRRYSPRTCGCGSTFMPTGPRALRCPACRGLEVAAG